MFSREKIKIRAFHFLSHWWLRTCSPTTRRQGRVPQTLLAGAQLSAPEGSAPRHSPLFSKPSRDPQTHSLERVHSAPSLVSNHHFGLRSTASARAAFPPNTLLAGHVLQFPVSMPLPTVFPTAGKSLFLHPPKLHLFKNVSFLQSSVQTPHPPNRPPETPSLCAHFVGPRRTLRTQQTCKGLMVPAARQFPAGHGWHPASPYRHLTTTAQWHTKFSKTKLNGMVS